MDPNPQLDACCLIQKAARPRVQVAYVYVARGLTSPAYAQHFVSSWVNFPTKEPCQFSVIGNGGLPEQRVKDFLQPLQPTYFEHCNQGWDIGGYQALAAWSEADLLVCFGQSVYFHRSGWLERLVAAWQEFGPGMYGAFSSFLVRAHLQTTAFAVSPKFLLEYPAVKTKADRYEFEHGQKSLWRRILAQDRPVKLVTWDGFWDLPDWRTPRNILWRGDQSNVLVKANHTDRWFGATPATKERWSAGADRFCG